MSPSQLHNNANSDIQSHAYWSPPLKINKASYTIKKSSSPSSSSSSPSSSSSSSSLANVFPKPPSTPPPPPPPPPLQQRIPPVIIYTHAPKVIRTTPCDFMALVQRLTGLSSSSEDNDDIQSPTKPETTGGPSPPPPAQEEEEIDEKPKIAANNDDNESSSVTTEENNVGSCSNNVGDGQMNSCFVSSQPKPCGLTSNIPFFKSKSAGIFCPNKPFYSYNNSFLFAGASMRTPVPTSSKLLVEGMKEFREY